VVIAGGTARHGPITDSQRRDQAPTIGSPVQTRTEQLMPPSPELSSFSFVADPGSVAYLFARTGRRRGQERPHRGHVLRSRTAKRYLEIGILHTLASRADDDSCAWFASVVCSAVSLGREVDMRRNNRRRMPTRPLHSELDIRSSNSVLALQRSRQRFDSENELRNP
jgi:hypothetical protein